MATIDPGMPRVHRHGWLAIRNRCLCCRNDAVAQLPWFTRSQCAAWRHPFERDAGYHTGAMYLSYAFRAVVTSQCGCGYCSPEIWIAVAPSIEPLAPSPISLFDLTRALDAHRLCLRPA